MNTKDNIKRNSHKNHIRAQRNQKKEEKTQYIAKYQEKKVQERKKKVYKEKEQNLKIQGVITINKAQNLEKEQIAKKRTMYQEKPKDMLKPLNIPKTLETSQIQQIKNFREQHSGAKKRKIKKNIQKIPKFIIVDEQRQDRVPSEQKECLKKIEKRIHKIFRKRYIESTEQDDKLSYISEEYTLSLDFPLQQALENLQKNQKQQTEIDIINTQVSEDSQFNKVTETQKRVRPSHNFSEKIYESSEDNEDAYQNMKNYFEDIEIQNLDDYVIYNLLNIKSQEPAKNIKMHEKFHSPEQYAQITQELFKYQILSDFDQQLTKLIDGQQKINKINIRITQFKDSACVIPVDKYNCFKDNQYQLKQALQYGSTIGILTFCPDLKAQYFDNNQATLCYLTKKGQNIFINGIDDDNIPKDQINFINLGGLTPRKRQLKAIVKSSQSKFINHIIGKTKNSFKQDNKRVVYFENHTILDEIKQVRNQSQFKAIQQILSAQEGFFLIQGPPGTGKTSTISSLVAAEISYYKSYRKRQKIVICSDSNAAIDHLGIIFKTKGLIGIQKMPKMVRLGHISASNRNLLDISLSHQSEMELLQKLDIIFQKTPTELKLQKQILAEKLNKFRQSNKYEKEIKKIRRDYQLIMEQLQRVNELVNQHKQQYDQIQKKNLLDADIILSTLNTSGKNLYQQVLCGLCNISCLIIDEAGQATEPSILIPFQINPKKVVIVGDHKQLNPTTFSPNVQRTKYNRSMFERFIENKWKYFLLNTQYRMVPQLSQFFNREFYNNKLNNCIIKEYPIGYKKMNKCLAFYDIIYGKQKASKKSFINEAEIEAIIVLLQKIIKEDKKMTIGIISHYKSQVKELQERIESLNLPQIIMDNIKISTVDSFQGQERDIIIISSVRSNEQDKVGFINDRKRLNVALSRCKFGMFVFGNKNTLQKSELWRNYIRYHEKRGSFTKVSSKEQIKTIICRNYAK